MATDSTSIQGPVTTIQVNSGMSPTISTIPVTISATIPNPNSRGINDVSDVIPTDNLVNLPTRAEKRILPTNISGSDIQDSFDQGLEALGLTPSTKDQIKDTDFFLYALTQAKRLQNAVDYIKVRILHRGINPSSLQSDPTQDVEFRFLVNPSTMTVNRQTVDSQSLTRGGWQFGVWGEDAFMVQMQGQSAASMFTRGTTDEFDYYAVSYRNLMQLQQVFENNGYWFEGEEANESALAPDYLRRRIKMHADVELWAGNFIWSGMFDSFNITQDAGQPFLLNFSLSFFVWKERYRSSSPYWGSIANNVQRGHSYSAVEGATGTTQTNNTLANYAPSAVASQSNQMSSTLTGTSTSSTGLTSVNPNTPYVGCPAVQASAAESISPFTTTTAVDSIGVQPSINLLNPSTGLFGSSAGSTFGGL